ncbi:hypothetical protein [Hymenobacter ruricola]|uniref:Outer membrane protein beta-barrel domain-containing protein n=1 Tax=Hymenobacter ruricola TaxID=2791023 RepID=A0ABS0I1T5_9BACT|nr:hypothetical protein [Hymenobacter ruricola]MBF9220906.1 hypothetical protein [Hymenobacter ruricola]
MFRRFVAVFAVLPALLASSFAHAQTGSPEPAKIETSRSVELRGGYTSGRFSHGTEDIHSSFSLFGGGGNSRPGVAVEHRFDGLLLGADYALAQHRPGRSTTTLRVGLDVVSAADRLRIGDGRRATVGLLAAHPHMSVDIQKNRWQTRVGVGMLVGRVGYYGQEKSFDLLSTNIVVDTVRAVPTFQFEMNWNHWVQYELGYGGNGLLGLANPTSYLGVGTGFGPRSPLALVVGVSSAASLNFERSASSFTYARVALAPAGKPWQANAFATFGSGQYQRMAVQVGYTLPGKAARSAGH